MQIGRRSFVLGALATPALATGAGLVFEHAYGAAILPAPARRVVSLGFNTQDPLIALGVMPVGIRYWYGEADGIWPWARPLAGTARAEVLTGEVSLETVARLAPDLIVGIGSGISEEEYAALSLIAPVLMQAPGVSTWGTSWQDVTRLLGAATGTEFLANARIAAVEARFARSRAERFPGMTAVAAWHDGGQTRVYTGQDTRAQFLAGMGFRPPAALERMADRDGFYTTLSPEDLSPLDADLLIWISAENPANDLARLAMRRTLRAYREGREIFLGQVMSGALSFGTVLSLPYALDHIAPEIALALDGNPATVVPSSVAARMEP